MEDLLRVYREAEKPRDQFRVGAEMEKFGVFADGSPILYPGERGIERIMGVLQEKGWVADRETVGAPVIALLRDGASITLEPGSQFELSGAPLMQAHQVCAEFGAHLNEIAPISAELGVKWLGLGFHPFASRADYTFVPKMRYSVMREYLPTRGALALDMMLRTSTVQANYDYVDEEDAMRKVMVCLRLGPLTTALFANSPWYEGKPWGGKTFRGKVWLDTDPDRSGLVPPMWKKPSYASYTEWALDIPMFMLKRDGKPVLNTGQTFRAFMKDGFEGHKALYSDWVTHLNTLFPEVRLKRTIEVRGADAQGSATACALPALYLGLLYDDKALAEAEHLTRDWSLDELIALRANVPTEALKATFRGRALAHQAEAILQIAEGGLERRAQQSPRGNDERVHLITLKEMASHAECPADRLLAAVNPEGSFVDQVITASELS